MNLRRPPRRATAAAPRQVLDFWFGAPGSPGHGEARAEWFRKSDAFDAQIAQGFGPLIERALRGELHDWEALPEGALARILLLDQFTRNAFRDSPRAFAGDALALEAARAMVAAGVDTTLLPVQRAFVYLPFEHAEDLAAQDEAVRLFTQLAQQAPGLDGMLDYAHRHRAVIARFGRFPHRNPWLGRASSEAELAFLQEPGSSF
jgi:uncharacterized protein (DUF924 family)